MWQSGKIGVYRWYAKVHDGPSPCGIGGGRVSKLEIWRGQTLVARYERGWDIVPGPVVKIVGTIAKGQALQWRDKVA